MNKNGSLWHTKIVLSLPQTWTITCPQVMRQWMTMEIFQEQQLGLMKRWLNFNWMDGLFTNWHYSALYQLKGRYLQRSADPLSHDTTLLKNELIFSLWFLFGYFHELSFFLLVSWGNYFLTSLLTFDSPLLDHTTHLFILYFFFGNTSHLFAQRDLTCNESNWLLWWKCLLFLQFRAQELFISGLCHFLHTFVCFICNMWCVTFRAKISVFYQSQSMFSHNDSLRSPLSSQFPTNWFQLKKIR